MIPFRFPLLFLLVFAALLGFSSGWSDTGSYPNTAERTFAGIRYELAADRFLFAPQDTVYMRYTIYNEEHAVIIFRSPTSHQIDFALWEVNADTLLWFYSEGKAVDFSVHYKRLAQNEKWEIQITLKLSGKVPSVIEELEKFILAGAMGVFSFSSSRLTADNRSPLGSSSSYSLSPFDDPVFMQEYFESINGSTADDPAFDEAFDVNHDNVINYDDWFILADQRYQSPTWMSLEPDSTMVVLPIIVRTVKADFDDNGTVDFDDFFIFSDHFGATWGEPSYETRFDLNGDGIINFPDFFRFADSFGDD